MKVARSCGPQAVGTIADASSAMNRLLAAINDSAKKVTVDGELFGIYSLEKEQEIKINDTNRMIIKDGQADMTEANCPDQICVDHKTISKNKETIICLPNKVIVEIVGGKDVEIDAVTN